MTAPDLQAQIAADEAKLAEDRRALDQQAALEAAFVAGTLPEEDRRAPDLPTDAGASLYHDNHTTPGNYGATGV